MSIEPVRWNQDKSLEIKARHGLSFDELVDIIREDGFIKIAPHHNPKFAHQFLMFVNVQNYVWTVPFVEHKEGGIFLKTAFPDRKATARLLEKSDG